MLLFGFQMLLSTMQFSLKDVGRTCANWNNQEHKQEHNNCFISVTDPYIECMEHCAGYR